MYRHTFFISFINEDSGSSRIIPIFSFEIPFVLPKTVRAELENYTFNSIPVLKLCDNCKDEGYDVSTSIWNIELSKTDDNETQTKEEGH